MELMVSIIGAGAIGTVIGNLINRKKASVNFLDRNEELIQYSPDLLVQSFDYAITQSDIIFIGIPSKSIRTVLEKMQNLKENAIVICLAKGIESDSLKTMDLVMEEILPASVRKGLLYGPMLAKEILDGQSGFAHLAIKDKVAYDEVNRLFESSRLYLSYSNEVQSIAFSGVLKNIYALAIGVSDGLHYGHNVKGWLAALAYQESCEILKSSYQFNREIEFSYLSDFIATAFSPDSRNHLVGETMAREGDMLVSEGTVALLAVQKLINTKSFALLRTLEEIFIIGENPKTAFENLILSSGKR